jgi:hypothetical protein
VENLKAFNRRERFLFSDGRWTTLLSSLGRNSEGSSRTVLRWRFPPDAFCAMNFPLDWIIGCLWLSHEERATYSVLQTGGSTGGTMTSFLP